MEPSVSTDKTTYEFGTDEDDRVARLIESQRAFYDLRAPDFGDEAT